MIYQALYDMVIPWVPGAPENLVLQEIRNSMIELCEKSLIVQRDHYPVTVLAGINNYEFEPPDGWIVVKIMRMWFKDQLMIPHHLDNNRSTWEYNPDAIFDKKPEGNTPRWYTQKDEKEFIIWPHPKETLVDAITMRVALKPTRICPDPCDVFPDELFEDYAEVIASGAKRRLMLIPKKPYSDPQQAGVEQSLFIAGLNMARQRATHGYVRSNMQVRLPRI
jgi:hypothetical protein